MENKAQNLNNSVKNYMMHNTAQANKASLRASFTGRARRAWAWLRSRDIATWTNVIVLCLAIAMMVVLIKVVQDNNRLAGKTAVSQKYRASQPKIVHANVPAKVSMDTKTGMTKIELPMKGVINKSQKAAKKSKPAPKYSAAEQKAASKPRYAISNAEWLRQEESIRPAARVKNLPPMAEINGNLYIQNMDRYVVPCGTKVRGDMIVRNVRRLSFCGCMEVRGNIYVGKGTSFGPLPANAKIGGQIIY
ncbi:MAG: hypothetical protein LBH81_02820 [Rickettsiales bacterium]|jgi:hypothetical protein|nr:hypothetical protein [Rickettsiales bacterium]